MKTICVGIATFNRSEFLKQTVEGIIQQNVANVIEIILVDQTPDALITDNLRSHFQKKGENISYLTQHPPAVCIARNTIISKSKADIVLFFDDDVILGPKCILSHLNAFNYNNVKSCIGHIHHRKPSFPVEELDINEPRKGTENLMTDDTLLDLDYKGVSISCNQSFDRKVLLELKGFDENYVGGYYEDADLGLRLKALGYKIAFHPEAMVVHIKAPQGGLRFEAKQPFTEVERLKSYVLFLLRYPTEYGFFNGLKSLLRAGPLRKANVVNPYKHATSWKNLSLSLIAALKVKNRVKSTVLENNEE